MYLPPHRRHGPRRMRKAITLLAEVEVVDHDARHYLLCEHCGVDLGKDGVEVREEYISARFVLFVEAEATADEDGDSSTVCSDLLVTTFRSHRSSVLLWMDPLLGIIIHNLQTSSPVWYFLKVIRHLSFAATFKPPTKKRHDASRSKLSGAIFKVHGALDIY